MPAAPAAAGEAEYAMHADGAVFAEVKVNPISVKFASPGRRLRAAAALSIPSWVRSQLLGGMIWGASP